VHCGRGSWGGWGLSLADYVAGRRPPGRRPPPQRANVDYPLSVIATRTCVVRDLGLVDRSSFPLCWSAIGPILFTYLRECA